MTDRSSPADELAPPSGAALARSGSPRAPIVVDLGKRRRKHIKQLGDGVGPIARDVAEVLAHLKAELSAELDGQPLVPIVLIYRKKARRRRPSVLAPFAR